jgi:hypothetical protein
MATASWAFPIGVDDPFGDVGMDEHRKRGEARHGDTFSHRHPRRRYEFGPASANGRVLAGRNTLAADTPPAAGETDEISLDVGS